MCMPWAALITCCAGESGSAVVFHIQAPGSKRIEAVSLIRDPSLCPAYTTLIPMLSLRSLFPAPGARSLPARIPAEWDEILTPLGWGEMAQREARQRKHRHLPMRTMMQREARQRNKRQAPPRTTGRLHSRGKRMLTSLTALMQNVWPRTGCCVAQQLPQGGLLRRPWQPRPLGRVATREGCNFATRHPAWS